MIDISLIKTEFYMLENDTTISPIKHFTFKIYIEIWLHSPLVCDRNSWILLLFVKTSIETKVFHCNCDIEKLN